MCKLGFLQMKCSAPVAHNDHKSSWGESYLVFARKLKIGRIGMCFFGIFSGLGFIWSRLKR